LIERLRRNKDLQFFRFVQDMRNHRTYIKADLDSPVTCPVCQEVVAKVLSKLWSFRQLVFLFTKTHYLLAWVPSRQRIELRIWHQCR